MLQESSRPFIVKINENDNQLQLGCYYDDRGSF